MSHISFLLLIMTCYVILVFESSDIVYLYVVNHNGKKKDKRETVEKFRFDQWRRTLCHLRTFEFEGNPKYIQ